MPHIIIVNPVINSPFNEPARHFRFSEEGITNDEVGFRRTSSYFIPVAKPKKKSTQQLQFNDIRRRVGMWRKGGYVDVKPTTACLIAYWTDSQREKKLFFREARDTSNPGRPRTSFKIATGSVKSFVMAIVRVRPL